MGQNVIDLCDAWFTGEQASDVDGYPAVGAPPTLFFPELVLD